jgi:hypothetical protein
MITIAYKQDADSAVAVTQSDTVDDPKGPFSGLYVPAGSTVKVSLLNDVAVTFTSVYSGFLMIPVKRVWNTGTAVASGVILGLFNQQYPTR